MTDTMVLIPRKVLADAVNMMARAYERIHSLPRNSDTALADQVESAKVALRDAAVPASASPVHPFPAEIKVWPRAHGRADPVAEVLALAAQPWMLARIARVLQKDGRPIPMKAEAEMAAALHFLLVHVLIAGDAGMDNALAELQALAGPTPPKGAKP